MADYTVNLSGVPFRIRNFPGSREEAVRQATQRWEALPDDKKRANIERRTAELKDLGVDLNVNPAEGMGGGEKFLVGAGRTFTELGRGIGQRIAEATDDEQWLSKSRQKESNERETFAQLDNQGIGFEDLGQIAPEIAAFIGSGGIGSLALRGAAMGASRATTEGESVTKNAILEGAFAAGGGAVARGLGSIFARGFKPSAKFTPQVAKGFQGILDKNPVKMITNLKTALKQADDLASSNGVQTKVKEAALNGARQIIREMNGVGRETLFRSQVDDLFKQSVVVRDGGANILDVGKFTAGLESYSRGKLIKELGKNLGPRLDNLRTGFQQLAKLKELSYDDASKVLSGYFNNKTIETMLKQLGKTPNPTLAQKIVEQSNKYATAAGAATGADTGNNLGQGVNNVLGF